MRHPGNATPGVGAGREARPGVGRVFVESCEAWRASGVPAGASGGGAATGDAAEERRRRRASCSEPGVIGVPRNDGTDGVKRAKQFGGAKILQAFSFELFVVFGRACMRVCGGCVVAMWGAVFVAGLG